MAEKLNSQNLVLHALRSCKVVCQRKDQMNVTKQIASADVGTGIRTQSRKARLPASKATGHVIVAATGEDRRSLYVCRVMDSLLRHQDSIQATELLTSLYLHCGTHNY